MTNQEREIINNLINSVNANTSNIGAIINGLKETGNQTVSNAEGILANTEDINLLAHDLDNLKTHHIIPLAEKLAAMEQTLTALTSITQQIASFVSENHTNQPQEKVEA